MRSSDKMNNMNMKTTLIRLVETSDAKFILKLRLNEKYNQYISEVSPKLQDQIIWINNYKKDEALGRQYYFIIERKDDGEPIGTVRIYDLQEKSYSWGSWILNENKTRYSAIESAFLVYDFGFNQLGYTESHFEVMKGNERVISFHTKMGATNISEDLQNYYFRITKQDIEKSLKKLEDKILG